MPDATHKFIPIWCVIVQQTVCSQDHILKRERLEVQSTHRLFPYDNCVAIVKHVVYRHFTCAHSFCGFMKMARLVVVGRESCFCWAPSTPRKLKEMFFLLEERCLKSTSFVYRYRNFITNGDGTAAVSLSSQSSFNNVDVAYHCLAMVRNL